MLQLTEADILDVYQRCGADPNCELVVERKPRDFLLRDLKTDYSKITLECKGIEKRQ